MVVLIKKKHPLRGVKYFFTDSKTISRHRFFNKIVYTAEILKEFTPTFFITFTFDRHTYDYILNQGKITCGYLFRRMMNRCKSYFKKMNNGVVGKYVRVVENGGKNGRLHIHLLLELQTEIPEKEIKIKFAKWWACGLIDLKKMTSQHMIFNYIMKYMSKQYNRKHNEQISDEEERVLTKHELKKKIYYKPAKGMRVSCSRGFTRLPYGLILYFEKIKNPDCPEEFPQKFIMEWHTRDSQFKDFYLEQVLYNWSDIFTKRNLEEIEASKWYLEQQRCYNFVEEEPIEMNNIDVSEKIISYFYNIIAKYRKENAQLTRERSIIQKIIYPKEAVNYTFIINKNPEDYHNYTLDNVIATTPQLVIKLNQLNQQINELPEKYEL